MTPGPRSPHLLRRRLRRALVRRRRLVAAVLLMMGVASGLEVLAPGRPTGTAVVVAARDLGAGALLDEADLTTVEVAASSRPDGWFADAATLVGRTVGSPVRRGEPITDVRLLGPGMLAGLPGLVAAPVRLADPAELSLVRTGDAVQVLASRDDAPAGAELATVVAESARVLQVDTAGTQVGALGPSTTEGGLLVVGVTPVTARALAAAQAVGRLSLILVPGGTSG